DGSAALNKMRGKKYGLVISDWNMEPMTGYDLLKEVRADPNLATTPFIMITAESKTENVIAAKKAGVNNYIVKPFNAATLKTKIDAVCLDMAMAYRPTLQSRSLGFVMPGLARGIHVFRTAHQEVDGRVKPGHDDKATSAIRASARGAGGRTAPSPRPGRAGRYPRSPRSECRGGRTGSRCRSHGRRRGRCGHCLQWPAHGATPPVGRGARRPASSRADRSAGAACRRTPLRRRARGRARRWRRRNRSAGRRARRRCRD